MTIGTWMGADRGVTLGLVNAPSEPELTSPMGERLLGKLLMVLSLAGAPIILFVLRRFDRIGGPVVVAGCGTLFVRDLTMVTAGAPTRLKRLPRLLLFTEVAMSATATFTGLGPGSQSHFSVSEQGLSREVEFETE